MLNCAAIICEYIILLLYNILYTQSNLSGSNIDGSFTIADSNSFWVPMKLFR